MTTFETFVIGQAVTIIGGLIGIYVKVTLKLKELEVRVNMVEKHDDAISKKLDAITEQLKQLFIQLQNKADR